ncbi:MAG: phenylacetate--CoA ligase family protein [Nocardioidaceae bacterium]
MSVTDALEAYRESRGPRVLDTLRAASGRVQALDRRLSEAGLGDGVPDVDALDTLPVLSKDALPALQKEHPPLGGLLADGASVVRLFASPGPIYEPQLQGTDPWRWAPALEACGIGAGEVVLNCFSYHLSPAGAMFDEACRAVGAVVIPGGVGGSDVQAQVIADLGVTAYIGLPSYLATLVEKFDALGAGPDRWRLRTALVTAEPLPAPLRAQLCERVPSVLMAYGTAEAGLIGYETEPDAGLKVPTETYVQICDPATGTPTEAGQPGEVVVSVLHPELPLVRFGTGDVSRWVLTDDGELRLAGVLGRVGAAVKVRGMFVHPHQARDVVASLRAAGVTAARFVVEQAAGKDVLRLEVVSAPGADAAAITERAVQQTRESLRVRPEVTFVEGPFDEAVLVDQRTWA